MDQVKASRTALLVVHLQPDIVSPGTAFGQIFAAEAEARDVVTRCNAAMTAVREAGGLVVPLRIAFSPDYADLQATVPLLQMVAAAGCLKDGTDGAALVDALAVDERDVVLTHQRPGPFTGSELQSLLQRHEIENVLVCGVATNASVESAARQASDLGYSTVVLSDACSASDGATHDASLASLGLFAVITTVDEATTQLA